MSSGAQPVLHPHPESWPRPVRWLIFVAQLLLVGFVAVVLAVMTWLQLDHAAETIEPELPATMEEVDWHDPQASQYCLACHKQVGLAIGGLDVERGHTQNVALDGQQLKAVADIGTVVGPGNTLICMSCHVLGSDRSQNYMLAETLENSQLCQHCHPGHYAQGTPHDLRISAPDEKNRFGMTVAEGGPCSACHMSHSYAREIMAGPLDPEGLCIPCHSAYHVAEEHARTTMDHPESRCRECHDPHDATHGAFLRAEVTNLCITCHEDYGRGLAGGMHPLGAMEFEVPAGMREAGAHLLEHPTELTCVICHDTHKAEHRALLHLTPDHNQLCLECHEDKLLEKSHAGVLPKHGQQPIMTAEQQTVVAQWGNPIGPEGELLCVSCHRVHGAEARSHLLSFRLQYGETCTACHPAEGTVAGSPHDLRIDFPDLENAAGLTPAAAGVCSPCHMAHQFPQERVVTAGDPGGQCIACHREGACGQKKLTGGVDHPDTACIECHNPHERRYGNFLSAPPEALCLRCHEDQAGMVGGPHDLRQTSEGWPAEAVAAGGPCLSCHVPHGGDRPDLYRFRTPTGFGNHDGVCMTCHVDAAWDADSGVAAIHPRKIRAEQKRVPLELVPTDVRGDKRVGCRTCHDPHGGPEPLHLARVKPDEPTEELCLHCHDEKRLIRLTGHAPDVLKEAGYKADSCKPCHAMHTGPADAWGNLLSPRFLMDYCATETIDGQHCVPCLACHQTEGPAPRRHFIRHPEVITLNVYAPGDRAYMPLYGVDGKISHQGQVTCRTCHISHGRVDLLERIEANEQLTDSEKESVRAQVRPFIEPNICTTCHGNSARLLFLFFHEPARRHGVELPGRQDVGLPTGAG
jgi:predicted CXXCH cytochrome family protein